MKIGFLVDAATLFLLRCLTNEMMPPSYWNLWLLLVSRSSSRVIRMPALRNASSRRRCASVSKLNSMPSKISPSGANVIFVPRFFVVPVISRSPNGLPRSYFCLIHLAVAPDFQIQLSRQRVHHGDAHAVQAARDFVAVVVELAAGVQDGEHDFRRGRPFGILSSGCRGRCR
jgi:hypothetical protein